MLTVSKTKLFIFSAFLLAISLNVSARSFPDFTQLVEEKSPAVVKIEAETKSQRQQAIPNEIPENVPDIFRHFFDPRQMPERNAQATGSGFLISEDGYVLTNNHVVEGATDVIVRLIDRREYKAEVLGLDPQSDLALLKIEETGLPFLKLANSDKAKVGEWVLAIGSPFGLDYSVTAGIISAIGRSIPGNGNQNYIPFIQTDVAINPGNSGGPLFNLNGEVVGINSQIYTRSGGSIGLSFAIPSNLAKNVVEQLKDQGRVDRGWLGVVIQDVDLDLAEAFGLEKPQGALIAQLEPGGPAETSGIKVSDIILEFNGVEIRTLADLPIAVGPVRAGTTVKAKVLRERKVITLDVTVGKRGVREEVAQVSPPEPEVSRIGLVVEPLTAELDEELEQGVLVTKVEPGSAAARAGVQAGDVIVQLDFQSIDNVDDFNRVEEQLETNKPQPIRLIREGNPIFRSLLIEE